MKTILSIPAALALLTASTAMASMQFNCTEGTDFHHTGEATILKLIREDNGTYSIRRGTLDWDGSPFALKSDDSYDYSGEHVAKFTYEGTISSKRQGYSNLDTSFSITSYFGDDSRWLIEISPSGVGGTTSFSCLKAR